MISKLDEIKRFWQGDALDIDDSVKDSDEHTAFDRFLLAQSDDIRKRLVRWLGKDVYADAAAASPADTDRAEAVAEAELNLLHAVICEQLIKLTSAGIEKDITFPSGTRVSLKDWSFDDYQTQIANYTDRAYTAVLDYL